MKLDHVAINVKDLNTSIAWYTHRLHAVELYRDESWALLEVGDLKIALTLSHEHPPHVALRTGGVNEFPCAASEVKEHRDGSMYYYGTDPDGNTIEWIWYPPDVL